jgi:hypothetical protein
MLKDRGRRRMLSLELLPVGSAEAALRPVVRAIREVGSNDDPGSQRVRPISDRLVDAHVMRLARRSGQVLVHLAAALESWVNEMPEHVVEHVVCAAAGKHDHGGL